MEETFSTNYETDTDRDKRREDRVLARSSTSATSSELRLSSALERAIPDALLTLHSLGYAVLPAVLTDRECDAWISGFWNFMETRLGIVKSNPESNHWIQSVHGIIKHSLGHEDFMWNVRSHRNVCGVFNMIHDRRFDQIDQNMISSFDACCVGRPPESRRYGHMDTTGTDSATWFHTDQHPFNYRYCVQGLVSMEETDSEDWTLAVLPATHIHHEEFFNEIGAPKGAKNWFQLKTEEQRQLLCCGDIIQPIRLNVPKGGMLLWDSRLFHCGVLPIKGRAHQNRWRYVQYVCHLPRRYLSDKVLAKRRKWAEQGRTTNHWGEHVDPIKPQWAKPGNYLANPIGLNENSPTEWLRLV